MKPAHQRRQSYDPTCPFCRRESVGMARGPKTPLTGDRVEQEWMCGWCTTIYNVISTPERTIRKKITRKGNR